MFSVKALQETDRRVDVSSAAKAGARCCAGVRGRGGQGRAAVPPIPPGCRGSPKLVPSRLSYLETLCPRGLAPAVQPRVQRSLKRFDGFAAELRAQPLCWRARQEPGVQPSGASGQ